MAFCLIVVLPRDEDPWIFPFTFIVSDGQGRLVPGSPPTCTATPNGPIGVPNHNMAINRLSMTYYRIRLYGSSGYAACGASGAVELCVTARAAAHVADWPPRAEAGRVVRRRCFGLRLRSPAMPAAVSRRRGLVMQTQA